MWIHPSLICWVTFTTAVALPLSCKLFSAFKGNEIKEIPSMKIRCFIRWVNSGENNRPCNGNAGWPIKDESLVVVWNSIWIYSHHVALAEISGVPVVLPPASTRLRACYSCTGTRGTGGIPCLPTSSVKYVHLLASVLPPCGMTQRAFLIAHDINWCDLRRESI